MQLGIYAVLISIILLIYILAAIYIVTRAMYRSIVNRPLAPYHLRVVLENDDDKKLM